MKNMFKELENSFAAVAFAEEGEFETAAEIMKDESPLSMNVKKLKSDVDLTIDNLTAMAISFAEAGESEIAREIMQDIEMKLNSAKKDLKSRLVDFYERYA